MRKSWRRAGTLAVAFLSGTMLFAAGSEVACMSFAADRTTAATNFCFLFDCQNGAYGGLIEFCNDSIINDVPLFTDCPQFENTTP